MLILKEKAEVEESETEGNHLIQRVINHKT